MIVFDMVKSVQKDISQIVLEEISSVSYLRHQAGFIYSQV